MEATRRKSRVSYFYHDELGLAHYGPQHPMKPTRLRMTHNLVLNYGLYKRLDICTLTPATPHEMAKFHSDDYIDFLARVSPDMTEEIARSQHRYNVGEDCPVFEGLFEFCSLSAGGSLSAARRLLAGHTDIAINWSGGLHHAKKGEASGFCYINDIVLAILELLRVHRRVLYIDIDIHHGDGVEEAFFTTDRVMTCSFHKYGEYFPGSGDISDRGAGAGKHYAVNVPLRGGINDANYQAIFKPVVRAIMERYRPDAVVLQCGADSLSGDRLGCFNLSLDGHGAAVEYVKSFNVPLLLLGGGGYTIRNVARAWTHETAIAVGAQLPRDLPNNDFFANYGPTYKLDVPAAHMHDHNDAAYLDFVRTRVLEELRHIVPAAPSVTATETTPAERDPETGREQGLGDDRNDAARRRAGHIAAAAADGWTATRRADRDVAMADGAAAASLALGSRFDPAAGAAHVGVAAAPSSASATPHHETCGSQPDGSDVAMIDHAAYERATEGGDPDARPAA